MVIHADDRIAAVLGSDPALLDVLIAASPTFERLRNPLMRKTMGRLVTVAQAARLAGIDTDALLRRLNGEAGDGALPRAAEPSLEGTSALPAGLAALPAERVTEVDVREDLRAGREPFARIMAAVAALPPGNVLRLRAIFEPVPLYAVLARRGLDRWTEQLAPDDWRVWFFPSAAAEATPRTASPAVSPDTVPSTAGAGESGEVVLLDVRGLEPPEPMMRTLTALATLPAGATLVQVNVRVPALLLPRLAERGFTHEVREGAGVVRVFIRRREDAA